MKSYIADTNFYLRFILQDVISQAKITEGYLRKAKLSKVSIFFPDEVILEMEFVLRSVYSVKREDLADSLTGLIKVEYVDVENRLLWIKTLEIYKATKISLLDTFLFLKAQEIGSEVLSFDEDFKKLKRYER